jgi:Tfp pilus assembly protein PilV
MGSPPGRDERGFTLIDIVMGLTVLGVGIFATMQVYLGSLAAVSAADSRATAIAIATREVEEMRAAPYDEVGFSSSATGYVATVTEGSTVYDTVVVSNPATTPQGTDETHSGIVFHTRRDILWMPTSYATHSWKRLVATITWTDKYGNHTVRQDAGVYPGGLGPVSAPTTTSTTAAPNPSAPTNLTATDNSSNPYDQIDLSWTAGGVAPSTWEINQSGDSGTTWVVLTTSLPVGTTTYSATGLSSGTTYQFRVRGVSGSTTSGWTTATASTQTPPPTCNIGAASVTPNPVKKKSNNTLNSNLVVTVNTSGTCTSLSVYFPVAPSTPYSLTKSSTTYSYTLSKNAYSNWSTGNKTATVKDSTNSVVSTIGFLVN